MAELQMLGKTDMNEASTWIIMECNHCDMFLSMLKKAGYDTWLTLFIQIWPFLPVNQTSKSTWKRTLRGHRRNNTDVLDTNGKSFATIRRFCIFVVFWGKFCEKKIVTISRLDGIQRECLMPLLLWWAYTLSI